jgi:hypothetical protein
MQKAELTKLQKAAPALLKALIACEYELGHILNQSSKQEIKDSFLGVDKAHNNALRAIEKATK